MRLDALLVHKPTEHLRRSVSAISGQPSRIKAELLSGALYHTLGGCHFSLANGGCRLDVDDDRVVEIDHIVGGIGKEGRAPLGGGPTSCRIGR